MLSARLRPRGLLAPRHTGLSQVQLCECVGRRGVRVASTSGGGEGPREGGMLFRGTERRATESMTTPRVEFIDTVPFNAPRRGRGEGMSRRRPRRSRALRNEARINASARAGRASSRENCRKSPRASLDPMVGIARLCHANSRLALSARYAMTPHISRLIARLHLLAPRRGATRARTARRRPRIGNSKRISRRANDERDCDRARMLRLLHASRLRYRPASLNRKLFIAEQFGPLGRS